MAGKFNLKRFKDVDVNDSFFDNLKKDYPGNFYSTGFLEWFKKKQNDNSTALIFEDEKGIGAFIYIKEEEEEIKLENNCILPYKKRLKIGTLRISERYQSQRLGEGALALTLWKWQKSKINEIYVTTFEKHDLLIEMLNKFGFELLGKNRNGENVYLRSREKINYKTPFTSFPYINPNINNSGYIIINDEYHDTLFPYSELKNTEQKQLSMSVANGITKVYLGELYKKPTYNVGDPVFVYRRFTGDGVKRYKSCLTSVCVIKKIIPIKQNYREIISYEEFIKIMGNKTVFNSNDLMLRYTNSKNLMAIEMVYFIYFGEGNNVNMDWLEKNNLWRRGSYPTETELDSLEFKKILKEAKQDVQNIIINKSDTCK